ncbi:hypothetical protein JZ751_024452, partial [Albula glossodonta]
LCALRERLEQAETERDRLCSEIEELRGLRGAGTLSDPDLTEDTEDMLDFPGDGLISVEPFDSLWGKAGMPMLETFEKDDTDMQSSSPDFVPTVLYDSLRKEFEELQERYSQAQALAEASSMTEEQGSAQKSEEGGGEGEEPESIEELKDKLRRVEEQLSQTQTELEELRDQVKVGVFSVEQVGDTQETRGGDTAETQWLRERVEELEATLAEKKGEKQEEDNNTLRKLREKVEELQAALAAKEEDKQKDKEAEKKKEESERVKQLTEKVNELEAALGDKEGEGKRGGGGGGEGDVEVVQALQSRVKQLQVELKGSVPRSELEEVRLSLGLQLEQLSRERAEAAMRLNEALLELERLRPPPHGEGDDEDDEEEEEEERSEGSEPS